MKLHSKSACKFLVPVSVHKQFPNWKPVSEHVENKKTGELQQENQPRRGIPQDTVQLILKEIT